MISFIVPAHNEQPSLGRTLEAMWWFGLLMRLPGMAGGAFMFCTRKAFVATGGFDGKLFGAEADRLLRLLLRLNPGDNGGVRLLLPRLRAGRSPRPPE